jgi:hypothetical protein
LVSPRPSGSIKTTFSLSFAPPQVQLPFLASKIGRLRADIIALMTSTTIHVQQAGGTPFSLEHLYDIARAEEKVAHQLFAKEVLMTAAPETSTAMSSITYADKFTTVSHQSCSPPCPGDNIKRIDPF